VFGEVGTSRQSGYWSNGDAETLKRVGDDMEIAKIEVRDIASKLGKVDPYLIGHGHEQVYRCAILLLSIIKEPATR
jgi:hypothetical protein